MKNLLQKTKVPTNNKVVLIINGDGGHSLLDAYIGGPVAQAGSKGQWPLGAVLYSSREPSELLQWQQYYKHFAGIIASTTVAEFLLLCAANLSFKIFFVPVSCLVFCR